MGGVDGGLIFSLNARISLFLIPQDCSRPLFPSQAIRVGSFLLPLQLSNFEVIAKDTKSTSFLMRKERSGLSTLGLRRWGHIWSIRYSFKTYYSVFIIFSAILFFKKIIILYFGGLHYSLIIFALYSLGQFY